ncbi:MAG: M15 family metallopeptidase [Caulobacter sp.]|nr:M15 family metallopeptidase [Caulobacter sp.]
MNDLRHLRERPIRGHPPLEPGWQADVRFDFTNPVSTERVVDVAEAGLKSGRYYSRLDGLNWPYNRPLFDDPRSLVRHTVAGMLSKANDALAAYGVELLVLDGRRTLEEQTRLWRFFEDVVASLHPSLDEDARRGLARRYCYDPTSFDADRPETWPVHMTGGSVDVTLVRRGTDDGLFMGGLFDDPSAVSAAAYFEGAPFHTSLDGGGSNSVEFARLARRLLVHSMEDVGFMNYPGEWWHFDFGTALWAHQLTATGHGAAAFYDLGDQR